QFDQQKEKLTTATFKSMRIWLRANCNFVSEKALFSYSIDGINFTTLDDEYTMIFQGRTFQGIRYSLFNYNTLDTEGGYADFNSFIVDEPRPHGLTKPVPYNKIIELTSLADSTVLINWKGFVRPVSVNDKLAQSDNRKFRVIDKGNGRIALQSIVDGGWVTVKGLGGMAEVRIEKIENGEASTFQWQDMLRGDLMLMSLSTHRYLFADPHAKSLCSADATGTRPDRKDGSCFSWKVIE
ncbi:MAG TPA: hypothetical protein VIM65_09950, partial [Cyclobacteriaceae bacterium]